MFVFGVITILGLCVLPGTQSVTLMCQSCAGFVQHPEDCTTVHRCAHDEQCSTEIRQLDNQTYFMFGCRKTDVCDQIALIGRRAANHDHNHHHTDHAHLNHAPVLCSQCCDVNGGQMCNKNLCASFMATAAPVTNATLPIVTTQALSAATTTTTAGATVATAATPGATAAPVVNAGTTAAATAADPCRDHEEDGLTCAALDLFRFCTDSSVLAYVLAHEKCPKHCGFCTPTTQYTSAPVTPPPGGVCTDYEQDGFQCSKFDLFGFCTDTSSLAYVVSHEKCRKHCGFCQTSGGK